MTPTINQLKHRIMARFIKLHREILRETIEITEVYLNVDNITEVHKQSGKTKFTYVGLISGYEEVVESPEQIMSLINYPGRF